MESKLQKLKTKFESTSVHASYYLVFPVKTYSELCNRSSKIDLSKVLESVYKLLKDNSYAFYEKDRALFDPELSKDGKYLIVKISKYTESMINKILVNSINESYEFKSSNIKLEKVLGFDPKEFKSSKFNKE